VATQDALDRLSAACSFLADAEWGVAQAEPSQLPVKLFEEVVSCLKAAGSSSKTRHQISDIFKQTFGSEDRLVQRLFKVVEYEVKEMCNGSSPALSDQVVEFTSVLLGNVQNASGATSRLLEVMLTGLERQIKTGSDTTMIMPLRDILYQKPLCQHLPESLSSLIDARLHDPLAHEIAIGEPCGSRMEESSSSEWLWAAGHIVEEVLTIMSDAKFGAKLSPEQMKRLGGLQEEMMNTMLRKTGNVDQAAPTSAARLNAEASMHSPRGAPARPSSGCMISEACKQVSPNCKFEEVQVTTSSETSQDGFTRVVLEIMIDMAGGVEPMLAKFVAIVEAELDRLMQPGNQSDNSSRIFVVSRLMLGAFELDGVDIHALAQRVLPGLLTCLLESVELPVTVRQCFRPLVELLLAETMVCHSADHLWHMLTDPRPGTSQRMAAPFVNDRNLVYAAGSLAVEIEDTLLLRKGDVRVEPSLQSMRCAQWVCHCQLVSMEESAPVSGPCAQPEKEKALRSNKRKATAAVREPPAKHRITSGQSDYEPSSEGSDWDESEDINSNSSDTSYEDGGGSDLEGFVDVAKESNTYGLVEQHLPTTSTAPASETMKTYMTMDLTDDYQDKCEDMLNKLKPEYEDSVFSPTRRQ
jgi:hypothetical protein